MSEGREAAKAAESGSQLWPPHVNVNLIELMPTCQGFGPLAIKRA